MKIKSLGLQDYQETLTNMQEFTLARIENKTETIEDEIWFLQHPPVFTQGYAGDAKHILVSGNIPIVQTDRGGQITYHGPGQLVVYFLFDLKRFHIGPKKFVATIEASVIDCLNQYGIKAQTRADAPGIYVDDTKICSLGLRIKQGYTYHGLALNVDMDLSPFNQINPCGYENLKMSQIKNFFPNVDIKDVEEKLFGIIKNTFATLSKKIKE